MLKGKDRERPPPNPTYMSSEQMASYLSDLRTQRTSRPSGSRPPPPSKFASLRRAETEIVVKQEHAPDERPALLSSNSMPIMPPQTQPIRSPFAGRPMARPLSALNPPNEPDTPVEAAKTLSRPASMTYIDSGTRWMEKQEARSLRLALEDMDLQEDQRVHTAAQDEAAQLVWKHKNPDSPFANPDAPYPNPDVAKDYRSHLRRGSYQRSVSQERVPTVQSRKSSGGSQRASAEVSGIVETNSSIGISRETAPSVAPNAVGRKRTPSGKSYGGLAEAVADDIAKASHRTSSGSKRILSGEKKMFMHRNDKIWEDPQEERTPPKKLVAISEVRPAPVPVQSPAHIRKNPFARVRLQQDLHLDRSNSAPELPVSATKRHSIDIQKNPPSQSRKPWYMSNEPLPPTPPRSRGEPADEVSPKAAPTGTPTKDGVEIRSDDIRAATSKQRKDRSVNLPQPTVVSNKLGRPIVSFQERERREVVLEEVHTAAVEPTNPLESTGFAEPLPPTPSIVVPPVCVNDRSMPPIPTICLPDDAPSIPTIVLPEEPDFASSSMSAAPATPLINVEPPSIPCISISGIDDAPAHPRKPAQRPLPSPTRPQPRHAATTPLPKSTPHYTPSVRQLGALCAHCALPIAGRILSAAGERFHPECFVCQQCDTNLECVAFYPEPEKQRSERLSRIHARQAGFEIPVPDDDLMTEDDLPRLETSDGDASLRFYCHLDFHELFSPRCKSCRTPIEGEIIVACGAEWHVGHFFCAQCGDPFDSTTPFVEKDGYAWCVGCHTNRYSSKCRKCKKPVTELVIKALGVDWHDKCFTCMECNGEFDDGRYFLRGESRDPVCVRCEEKRLKA